MTFDLRDDGGTVSVVHEGTLLARYNADVDASKPGFDTIALPTAVETKPGENLIVSSPHDHPWHFGTFFCQKNVDGINCWESELNEESGRTYGYAEHERYDVSRSADSIEIVQEAVWKTDAGETLLDDSRTIRIFKPDGSGYFITWDQAVTARDETRHLSSESLHGHYSGLSTRFARSLTDGRVLLPGDTEPGQTSPPRAASGPTGEWCDYSGALDGKTSAGEPWTAGITMFDHPANDCHPVNWFIMTEPFGFLAANPTWETVLTLEPGESRSWTWGLWVHSDTPSEYRVTDAYGEFISLSDGSSSTEPGTLSNGFRSPKGLLSSREE